MPEATAEPSTGLPVPLAHAALGLLLVLPLVTSVPTNFNIVLTAVLTVRGALGNHPSRPGSSLPYTSTACNSRHLLLACLQVYVGSWRSVKPEPPAEAMSKKARRLCCCGRGQLAEAAQPARASCRSPSSCPHLIWSLPLWQRASLCCPTRCGLATGRRAAPTTLSSSFSSPCRMP